METVGLEFFINQKNHKLKMSFFVFNFFSKLLGCVFNQTQNTKTLAHSKNITIVLTVLLLRCIGHDLNCLRVVLHKGNDKCTHLLNFGRVSKLNVFKV